MTQATEARMAELYAQGIYPAYAAVTIANEFGFDNVRASDDGNIEFAGTAFVATCGAVWLDICGDEKPALALLDMQVCEHVDGFFESVGACLADLQYDAQRLDDFACLFVF